MYRDFSPTINNSFQQFAGLEISEPSRQLLDKIFKENPQIRYYISNSGNYLEFKQSMEDFINQHIEKHPNIKEYLQTETYADSQLNQLSWQDVAAVRIKDYLENEGLEIQDLNLRGKVMASYPFKVLYLAAHQGKGGGNEDFFRDLLHLFRQFNGTEKKPQAVHSKVKQWMDKHPSGLDPAVINERNKNRDRIIRYFVRKIDSGEIQRSRFQFDPGMTDKQKYTKVREWWNDWKFHLQLAVRSPKGLNELLGNSLDKKTMSTLEKAAGSGIPFFANPYYLTLVHVNPKEQLVHTDEAIRDYVFVSEELVNEFGHIIAWEKEDQVIPGEPNAAGWILPNSTNIHRRYPEVAILIPDTVGRACGGLCVSCQRMFDFQNGHLNFSLEKLKPKDSWWDRLPKLMKYFEEDSHLRDILITGGDALMSSDKSILRILNEVYQMALRKREANKKRPPNKQRAEIQRIRLGTRLPVYLPQRITPELVNMLKNFRIKARNAGIKQFIIQTHFQSAMEITPESSQSIQELVSTGWMVINQCVFTTGASRRGHTAKLRKALNDLGVVSYYTFSVKGYMENAHTFTNNARSMQEQLEEKFMGHVPANLNKQMSQFHEHAENMKQYIDELRQSLKLPFLATDRNVMNLPGVGKSFCFRTIGITHDGRRFLKFEYDKRRMHSPIINKLKPTIIIESRSLTQYMKRLEEMGEDSKEYNSVWGYSIGETETRMPLFEYPEFNFDLSKEMTNVMV